jgi:hypothetical protein
LIFSFLFAAGLSAAVQRGCENCHAEVARSFAATGMGRSVGLPVAARARLRHELSGSVLSIENRRHRIERGGLSAEYPAELRIGSGKAGSSFGVRIAGQWFQSPVSFFGQSGQFRISPGYESEKYPDFDRRIRGECLYCHSSREAGEPVVIGCERCHGDGRAHALKPVRENIVNPARLRGANRDSVCEQCHLPGAVRIIHPGKQAEDYAPGQVTEDTWTTFVTDGDFRVASHAEQLAKSACMNVSEDRRLWCGSCHNPHPTKAKSASLVDAVCQTCHPAHEGGRDKCAECHMPRRGVQDVVHTTYTDHRIQLPVSAPPATSSGLRPWRAGPRAQRNLALAWFEWAASARDAAAMQRASELLRALPRTESDPQVLAARGAISLEPVWFEKALRLQPKNAELHFQAGRAEQAAKRLDAALERYSEAIRLDPLLFDAYVMSAQVHRSRSDWRSYKEVLRRYLKHVPASLAARQALAASPN